MKIWFHSFKGRILTLTLTLVVTLLSLVYLAVNFVTIQNAERTIAEELRVGARIFERIVKSRADQMELAVSLLSSDFAFKQACATEDRGTIRSALLNHKQRIGAGAMTLVSLDGEVVASTFSNNSEGRPFPYYGILETAEEEGQASGLVLIEEMPYQIFMAPLLAPIPIAWVVVSIPVGDIMAEELAKISDLTISFVAIKDGKPNITASSFQKENRDLLSGSLLKSGNFSEKVFQLPLKDEIYISLMTPIGKVYEGGALKALLQRSLTKALDSYSQLHFAIITVMVSGFLLAALTGLWISSSVSRPVEALVKSVKRIEEGDYSGKTEVTQKDEIGHLASAIDSMAKGLEEKDRVRNLLGKVVSPAIAEELMSKEIELGGEEKTVTILFSDIRDFTSHSEKRDPKEVLQFLNVYLTKMSSIIENNGGVIDKYIGDAIMALFGAPLIHPDDPKRAVVAGLEMIDALNEINRELASENLPEIDIGIGINSDLVVAGNMGSSSRLNYTVIGDGVNLASRIEGLTKKYGAKLLISDQTYKAVRGEMLCRELDIVRVAGKETPVTIYEVLAERKKAAESDIEFLSLWEIAIKNFRSKNFNGAIADFEKTRYYYHQGRGNDKSSLIYIDRSKNLLENPPQGDWDLVYSHTK